jgi:hypothetical protein
MLERARAGGEGSSDLRADAELVSQAGPARAASRAPRPGDPLAAGLEDLVARTRAEPAKAKGLM